MATGIHTATNVIAAVKAQTSRAVFTRNFMVQLLWAAGYKNLKHRGLFFSKPWNFMLTYQLDKAGIIHIADITKIASSNDPAST
jgi:hypothetical protein